MSKRREAERAVSRRRTESRPLSAALEALRNFVRGYAGLAPLGRDPASVRHALEHRAAGRNSCC
jgi:hypothetical protein